MKKLTATIVSVTLMISALAVTANAGATIKSTDVMKELNSTANYLATVILSGDEDSVYKNDRTIMAILKAEAENEELKTAYLNSLKKALDNDGGKLLYQGVESPSYYTGAIAVLNMIGKNPSNFEGYNLVESFNKIEKSVITSQSPYILSYILEFVAKNGELVQDKTIATDLVNALKALYKEDKDFGNGYDYWGITVDTSGTIIPALFPYCHSDNELKTQVEKSTDWLLEQYTDKGYNYGIQYPGINGNSTGLALYALAETGDLENAEKAYKTLSNFKSEDVEGAYGYNNTSPNPGATNNIITGLVSYYTALKETEKVPDETTTEAATEETTTETEITTQATQDTTAVTTTAVSTTKQSSKNQTSVPKTGTMYSPIALFVAFAAATGIIVISRKKETV